MTDISCRLRFIKILVTAFEITIHDYIISSKLNLFVSDLIYEIMAPQKDPKKLADQYVKESLLFKYCQKGAVPSSYVGLHSCERNFGLVLS